MKAPRANSTGSGAGAFVHTDDYVVVYFLYDIWDTQPPALSFNKPYHKKDQTGTD